MMKNAHKIGAVFYILWGILHIVGGAALLQQLSAEGATGVLAAIGSAVPPDELPLISGGVASSVLGYHAWNILWFGIFAVVIGVVFNWKNSPIGYWLNLSVIGAVDLGLTFAHLVPGYMALSDGLWGVGLWILAAIFSTIGLLNGKKQTLSHAVSV